MLLIIQIMVVVYRAVLAVEVYQGPVAQWQVARWGFAVGRLDAGARDDRETAC